MKNDVLEKLPHYLPRGKLTPAHSSSPTREAWEILTLLHLWLLQVRTQLTCAVHLME